MYYNLQELFEDDISNRLTLDIFNCEQHLNLCYTLYTCIHLKQHRMRFRGGTKHTVLGSDAEYGVYELIYVLCD